MEPQGKPWKLLRIEPWNRLSLLRPRLCDGCTDGHAIYTDLDHIVLSELGHCIQRSDRYVEWELLVDETLLDIASLNFSSTLAKVITVGVGLRLYNVRERGCTQKRHYTTPLRCCDGVQNHGPAVKRRAFFQYPVVKDHDDEARFTCSRT
jgi:hypothetical protein